MFTFRGKPEAFPVLASLPTLCCLLSASLPLSSGSENISVKTPTMTCQGHCPAQKPQKSSPVHPCCGLLEIPNLIGQIWEAPGQRSEMTSLTPLSFLRTYIALGGPVQVSLTHSPGWREEACPLPGDRGTLARFQDVLEQPRETQQEMSEAGASVSMTSFPPFFSNFFLASSMCQALFLALGHNSELDKPRPCPQGAYRVARETEYTTAWRLGCQEGETRGSRVQGQAGWGAVVSGLARLGLSGEMTVELRSENKTLVMSWALPI